MAAAGIDLGTTFEAIRISSGNSFVHETESQLILNGSRDIGFTMDLVLKDIGLFQAIAERERRPAGDEPDDDRHLPRRCRPLRRQRVVATTSSAGSKTRPACR